MNEWHLFLLGGPKQTPGSGVWPPQRPSPCIQAAGEHCPSYRVNPDPVASLPCSFPPPPFTRSPSRPPPPDLGHAAAWAFTGVHPGPGDSPCLTYGGAGHPVGGIPEAARHLCHLCSPGPQCVCLRSLCPSEPGSSALPEALGSLMAGPTTAQCSLEASLNPHSDGRHGPAWIGWPCVDPGHSALSPTCPISVSSLLQTRLWTSWRHCRLCSCLPTLPEAPHLRSFKW